MNLFEHEFVDEFVKVLLSPNIDHNIAGQKLWEKINEIEGQNATLEVRKSLAQRIKSSVSAEDVVQAIERGYADGGFGCDPEEDSVENIYSSIRTEVLKLFLTPDVDPIGTVRKHLPSSTHLVRAMHNETGHSSWRVVERPLDVGEDRYWLTDEEVKNFPVTGKVPE